MSAGLIPYSPHGEETRHSQKARQNPEIQGAPARRAADRAGAGGTAQSRDQPRRCRHGFRHRPAAAAGQFEGPPRRRRGRGASRARLDAAKTCRRSAADRTARNAVARQRRCAQSAAAGRARRPQGLEEAPQANYGTSATIPTLDPELAQAARPHHRGGRRRGAGAAAAQQDGSARRQGHRRRAGKPDPRRPPRIQGRGRPGENLDAAPPAAPGKIRRRRAAS